MTNTKHTRRFNAFLALALAVTVALSAGIAGVAFGATTTEVSVVPDDGDVDVGQTTTFEVVVETTDNGVGAVEGTLELTDSSVATITDVSLEGTAFLSNTEIASDGSSASFEASYGNDVIPGNGPSASVVTVTVEGTDDGATDVELSDIGVYDANGDPYSVSATNSATLTVTGQSAGDMTVAEAVASYNENGDDSKIDTQEIQQAVNWWQTDAEVPNTGGETIDTQQIQELTNLWQTDATVGGGDPQDPHAAVTITETSVDGDTVTVSWDGTAASDSDHVHVQLDDDAYVDGQAIDGSYSFEDVAPGEHTVSVTVADASHTEYDGATDSATVTVADSGLTGSALVEITPDSGNIDESTYGGGTYQITNTGEKEITSVSFDLSTASFPDMVFDPQGTAGDPTGEGLNIASDGGTGITTAEGGSEAFSQPHNGQNADDGYDVMTVEFDDFQSGETATFWADNDPTSIKGATVGSQEAGPVSGLELARSTVTVTYADGTTQTTQLMGDGSNGGSTAVVTDDESPAPTLDVQGVSLDGGVLDDYHSGATVSEAGQTISVSGEPGETVTLVRVEGELALSNVPDADGSGEPGYELEALEANNAVTVEYYTVTLDSNGDATVPVTLTDGADDDDDAGFNYFAAAHGDASGDMGLASNVVVLEYDGSAGDDPSGDAVFAVNAGGSEYTATDGTVYAADANFDGGQTFSTGSSGTPSSPDIANTDDDQLYYTERYGDFSYDVAVDDGEYEVELLFAEIFQGVANDGGEGDRLFDVAIEGQQVLDDYDIYATAGGAHAATTETFTVDVTDGELNVEFSTVEDSAKVSAIKVTEAEDGSGGGSDVGSADIAVNENGGLGASTFSGGSFEITNTGDEQISSVTFDVSESLVPDAVFDPDGTAGDATAKQLSIDSQSGDGVGVVSTADGDVFSQPHNGVDNAEGYDVLTLGFDDFESGETVSFSIDLDPTVIKDAGGSGGAGSVSGLEIVASAVTVEYADGSTQTTDLAGDGSAGGAQATAKADVPAAPTLDVQGVSLSGTDFPGHAAATVDDTSQTLTLDGPADATVQLTHVVGAPLSGSYDLDDYEIDSAASVDTQSVTLDSSGSATVLVSLSESNPDYFVATVEDGSGDTGRTSDVVILEYDGSTGSAAEVLHRVNVGESTTLDATDDGPDWVGVVDASSPYLASVASDDAGTYCSGDDVTADGTVPSSTPDAVFDCERYGNMTWEFPVDSGEEVEVRLYLANSYPGASEPGERQFDVSIEGQQVLTQYDPVADVGHATGTMKSFTVTDDGDGSITITFEQGAVENPEVRGIEILGTEGGSP